MNEKMVLKKNPLFNFPPPCHTTQIYLLNLLLSFVLLFIFSPTAIVQGKEKIRNVTVETIDQNIYVSARLTGGFHKEIIRDIHNGIPKNFYYYLVLKRKDSNWFDEEILSKTLRYTVKYDTLKKSYLVATDIDGESTEKQLAEFQSMKDIVTQVDHVQIARFADLIHRSRYYISVKSQMRAAERPFYLDYFLFFIPFLEIDTPWENSPRISFTQEK